MIFSVLKPIELYQYFV